MSNPFALFSIDDFEDQKPAKKQQPQPKVKAAPAAQKQQPKAVDAAPSKGQKAPLQDRHTKNGRDAGADKKRPYDRHLNRQTAGQQERKGQDRAVKGGWSEKDPEADQVTTDEQQAKEVAADEALPEVQEPAVVVPQEPAPITLDDILAAKVKPAEDKKKARKAVNVAVGGKTLNAGQPKVASEVVIKRVAPVVQNKKTLSLDEFKAVHGAAQPAAQPFNKRRNKPLSKDAFPAL